MTKFILVIDRLVNLYMYYVAMACLLSWVPNINPDYPLFHFIFKSTGFFILKPFLGFIFTPLLLMVLCSLVSMGLQKLYEKLNKDKNKDILILSPEEFFSKMEQERLKQENKENSDDDNVDNSSNS